MGRSKGLQPKHLKALEMLANNDASIASVAKDCGISRDHLYDLIAGEEKAGPVAAEFRDKLQTATGKIEERTSLKIKQLKESAITKMIDWVNSVKDGKSMSAMERRTMVEMLNSLNRSRATYNIGSLSYSKGMTGEDLLNEFRRLSALAQSALERRAVSGIAEGTAGLLSAPLGRRDKAEEGPEAGSV